MTVRGEPMNAEQITTIVTNVLTSGGVIFFLGMWIRALKSRIVEMNRTIEVQQQTLKAMETRVLETEKIGNIYRQFLEDFPKVLENYRSLHTRMTEDQIKLLEKAIAQKDEKLKETAEIELEKLKLQQRALDDIPKLREELIEVIDTFEQRMSIVNMLARSNSLSSSLGYHFTTEFARAFLRNPTMDEITKPAA